LQKYYPLSEMRIDGGVWSSMKKRLFVLPKAKIEMKKRKKHAGWVIEDNENESWDDIIAETRLQEEMSGVPEIGRAHV